MEQLWKKNYHYYYYIEVDEALTFVDFAVFSITSLLLEVQPNFVVKRLKNRFARPWCLLWKTEGVIRPFVDPPLPRISSMSSVDVPTERIILNGTRRLSFLRGNCISSPSIIAANLGVRWAAQLEDG